MAQHLLQVKDVAKSYGDSCVLKDVSFTLDAGESVSITSPSGSGKSTILAIVGLLLEPDAGCVLVDGVDALRLDDDARARLRREVFGFVFQHTQLIGSLRAYENAAVPARFTGKDDQGADDRARELLTQLGLGQRLDHYPHQLSVGQKRRVAVARALLLSPRIVIADEPTNDLDADSAHSVAAKLFSAVEEGKGLVLVTHDMELASKAQHHYELIDGALVRKR